MDIKAEEKTPKNGWMYTAKFNQLICNNISSKISNTINTNIKLCKPHLKKQYIIWVVLYNYYLGIPPFEIYLENLDNYGLLGHSVNSILKYIDFINFSIDILPSYINCLIKSYLYDLYGIISYKTKEITIVQPLVAVLQNMRAHELLNIDYEGVCGFYQSRKRNKIFCGIFFKPVITKEYGITLVHNVSESKYILISRMNNIYNSCIICCHYVNGYIDGIRLCSYCRRTACIKCCKHYPDIDSKYKKCPSCI